MRQKISRLILVSTMAMSFAGCGDDESFNSDVQFDNFPESPFVFPNDTTSGGGDSAEVITGPWYMGGFTIVNKNTRYQLIIPSLLITYQGFKNGSLVEKDYTLDASICDQVDPLRNLYAVIEPAVSATQPTIFFGDDNCDAQNDGIADRELLFFEGLPEVDSLNYNVTVKLEGFMFDATSNTTDPIKGRVTKIISFTTQ